MNHAPQETGVLVVGAGPVGLSLACELRRHGVPCRIIDDQEAPTPPEQSRALAIHARTLEVFEGMGVVAPVLERGRRVSAINAYRQGRPFANFELDFTGLGTPYPFLLSLSQGETEAVLVDRLARLGGAVEWRTKLEDLAADERGVTATLGGGGQGRQVRSSWLVGCDGAHSAVRHCLGLPFEGTHYPELFLIADVRLTWPPTQDEAHLFLTPDGPMAAVPMPRPGYWRLIDATGSVEASDQPAILARFRSLLNQSGPGQTTLDDPIWTSSFRISRRVVSRLRVGRCLLAGDAAHIHSPVGGQGMNTGIQDAHNLAWKLSLVLAGAAPESLVDSYQAERLPVAQAVLRGTDRATRLATLRNPLARWVRNHLVAWLFRLPSVRRLMTRQLSELGINYRRSPVVADHWSGATPAGVPQAGDRVPDFTLLPGPGPARLFDLLRGTHHTLLLFEGGERRGDGPDREIITVNHLVRSRWPGRIVPWRVARPGAGEPGRPDEGGHLLDPDGRLHQQFGARLPSLYLIRPDGYVGYRGQPIDPARFAAYMGRVLLDSARQRVPTPYN